jgi:hypothetical protein
MKGVEELHSYVRQNRQFIPNYGERYRNGELISSGFVESTVRAAYVLISLQVSRLPDNT